MINKRKHSQDKLKFHLITVQSLLDNVAPECNRSFLNYLITTGCSLPLPQPLQHIQSQSGPLVSQHQPSVLHGAGELRHGRQSIQGLLGAQCLGSGPCGQPVDLVRLGASWRQLGACDEAAEVSAKHLHPLERLSPKVEIPFLKQEVLLILVTQRWKLINFLCCLVQARFIYPFNNIFSGTENNCGM